MKPEGQKMKLLYLKELFEKESDENHVLTTARILEYLESIGISTTRKTVYDDINALREYGMDIVGPQNQGYALVSRDFDVAELRLLIDMVQSTKFLSDSKSRELITKLENQCSKYEAQDLKQTVILQNRVKTPNEDILRTVYAIHAAISDNRKMEFDYFEYDENKERAFIYDQNHFLVSPIIMLYENENYYLYAYDTPSDAFYLFRVDQIINTKVRLLHRDGLNSPEKKDPIDLTKNMFSMQSGQFEKVTIRFLDDVIGEVMDQFGYDIFITKDGPYHFTTTVSVAVSPKFYGWIYGLGDDAEILAPEHVRKQMKKRLNAIKKIYKD